MKRRCAFTLIELLVVIVIFSLLMAMIMPALQRVRAAADRLVCASQLRQIGIALHHYHSDHQRLPEGVRSSFQHFRMSWMTQLLPYIEQDSLWQTTLAAYAIQPLPFVYPIHKGLATPIKLFSCPSDERMGTPHVSHMGFYVAHTSYLGVLGTDYQSTKGCLYRDSRIRLTDIYDGTSNTIMVGERPPSPDYWYGWWYAGWGQAGTGSGDMLLGSQELNAGETYTMSCPPGPYSFRPGKVDDQCSLFHFWSLHPSGAHFLSGDGSVRFLSYSLHTDIMPALSTRNGGEAVELP